LLRYETKLSVITIVGFGSHRLPNTKNGFLVFLFHPFLFYGCWSFVISFFCFLKLIRKKRWNISFNTCRCFQIMFSNDVAIHFDIVCIRLYVYSLYHIFKLFFIFNDTFYNLECVLIRKRRRSNGKRWWILLIDYNNSILKSNFSLFVE